MPFGIRMINHLLNDLDACEAYIDYVIVHSDTFQEHLLHVWALFVKLSNANLTVSLMKTEFCHAAVEYLGHYVGNGHVRPVFAKVNAINAILNFPAPQTKKELMRFLGMAGYYRKFCPNFSTIANPLTCLLKKKNKFIWDQTCQQAFDQIKTILMVSSVPNQILIKNSPYKLMPVMWVVGQFYYRKMNMLYATLLLIFLGNFQNVSKSIQLLKKNVSLCY